MRLSGCSIPRFYSTLENNSDNNNKQLCTGLFLKQAGSRLRRGKDSSPSPHGFSPPAKKQRCRW